MYAHDLQLHRSESHPRRVLLATSLARMELKETVVLGLQPCPRDVHVLEIHVSTLRAQALHLCLNAKQNVRGICTPRDVKQDMLARLHQIESLAVDVHQVRIPLRAGT
jgi:hypothetical protein